MFILNGIFFRVKVLFKVPYKFAFTLQYIFGLIVLDRSLEQSPVFTARTHRHHNFQTQTKDHSFLAGLSLNLCSSVRFVFILFYFSSHYVIHGSILFCKRNSLWTMNYWLDFLVVPAWARFSCSVLPCSYKSLNYNDIVTSLVMPLFKIYIKNAAHLTSTVYCGQQE